MHFLASFFGPGWGYLGGSVPFALMHFCTGWFSWRYFFCITSAGLMLSAVYLEYGLLAAIGVHYAWNVLSCFLIDVLHWPVVGRWALEGEWTTTLINLIAAGAVVMVSRRRKLTQQRLCASDSQDVNAAEKERQELRSPGTTRNVTIRISDSSPQARTGFAAARLSQAVRAVLARLSARPECRNAQASNQG